MEELTGDYYASVNSDRDNASENIDRKVYTALSCTYGSEVCSTIQSIYS